MDIISLENIRIYAYHGCLKEEVIIGSDYVINLKVYGNFSSTQDELSNTLDYSILFNIIQEEMATRSNLIEHVAERILSKLKKIPTIQKAKIKISKINPPLNGEIEKVSVILRY